MHPALTKVFTFLNPLSHMPVIDTDEIESHDLIRGQMCAYCGVYPIMLTDNVYNTRAQSRACVALSIMYSLCTGDNKKPAC